MKILRAGMGIEKTDLLSCDKGLTPSGSRVICYYTQGCSDEEQWGLYFSRTAFFVMLTLTLLPLKMSSNIDLFHIFLLTITNDISNCFMW